MKASVWFVDVLYFMWIHQVWREKNVIKPAPGKRRCNCRNQVYHKQIGPGMFQQMTEQVSHYVDKLVVENLMNLLYTLHNVRRKENGGKSLTLCLDERNNKKLKRRK